MPSYINPFTDFGFKKLFGEEESKIYLIDFLNSVFEGYIPQIAELSYGKNEHLGNTQIDRNAIFDLYCKNEKGERFIIELQKAKQTYFRERTLFYSTFAIQEQAEKNEWNFKLDPIYCIGILNFKFDKEESKYFHFGKIIDTESHKTLIDTLNFAYLECPKFNKKISQDSTNHDKWLYVLTQLERLEKFPQELQNKIFEGFFNKANILKLTPEDKEQYNNSIKYYRDNHNVAETARLEGKREGEVSQAIKMAQKMKLDKVSLEVIAKYTGLDILQIENL
jgi:predicted transposase/invertase (TIGR01784 family)